MANVSPPTLIKQFPPSEREPLRTALIDAFDARKERVPPLLMELLARIGRGSSGSTRRNGLMHSAAAS